MRFVCSTLVCVTILFAACEASDPHSEQSGQVSTSHRSTAPPQDTIQRTFAKLSASGGLPSNALIVQIAHIVDSLGWISDTARFKIVSGYWFVDRKAIVWSAGRPFFKLATPLKYAWHLNDDLSFNTEYNVDTAAILAVKQAWAYFYRDIDGPKNRPDGLIETWEFHSEQDATTALRALVKAYPRPYFNTTPQYFVLGNSLVIGNTRASNDSYYQGKVFNVLRERFPVSDFYPRN